MENKYDKSGKLSKRTMKLMNYEDKISKMSKEDFLKELEKVSKCNELEGNTLLGAVSLIPIISLELIWSSTEPVQDKELLCSLLLLLEVVAVSGIICCKKRENDRKKKLDILLKYVDSEEGKEEEKDRQKKLSK